MPDAFRPIEDFIRGLDDDALYVAWPGGRGVGSTYLCRRMWIKKASAR
jgi:hypothetical protein